MAGFFTDLCQSRRGVGRYNLGALRLRGLSLYSHAAQHVLAALIPLAGHLVASFQQPSSAALEIGYGCNQGSVGVEFGRLSVQTSVITQYGVSWLGGQPLLVLCAAGIVIRLVFRSDVALLGLALDCPDGPQGFRPCLGAAVGSAPCGQTGRQDFIRRRRPAHVLRVVPTYLAATWLAAVVGTTCRPGV